MLTYRASLILLAGGLAAPYQPGVPLPSRSAEARIVELKVSADPEFRRTVEKAMGDELRNLRGVVVAETDPDYTISVIVLKVVNQSQQNVGATFSVLITEPTAKRIREFADFHYTRDSAEQWAVILAGTVKLRSHWVETAAVNEVGQVAQGIVQAFARETLGSQPDR